MATPTPVIEHPAWILISDVVTLVSAPLLAVSLVIRSPRAQHGSS